MIKNLHSKKIILLFFITITTYILLIRIFQSPILALEEGFYSTISFSINSIEEENVAYKRSQIVGEYSQDVIRRRNIDFFTEDEYKRRIYNLNEDIALPPLSVIDVGYYWYNNTPYDVDVELIRLPLSRQIHGMGDIGRVLYDIGFEEGSTCSFNICRIGRHLDIEGVGFISSDMHQNPRKGVAIEQLTIKLPVEITGYEVKYFSEHMSELTLYVENKTDSRLEHIGVNFGNGESMIVDLEPFEEEEVVLYKRCERYGNEVNCGRMSIIDNNTRSYCMGFGSPWDTYHAPDSVTHFNKIGNEWVTGAQLQPTYESFCIQRIPYVYTTEEVVVYIEPELPPVTDEEYWQDLLNIEILPITSKQFDSFNRYVSLLKPRGIDNLKVL